MDKYNNWHNNSEYYTIVEDFVIRNFITTIDKKNSKQSEWISPFFNDCFANGTKMMDGNPLFSAKHITKQYIIRVILDDDYETPSTKKETFDDIPLYTYYTNVNNLEKISQFFEKVL